MSDDVAEIQKKLKAEFASVERADGYLVISRYGFKKTEVAGKYYLEPMSKDEADAIHSPAAPHPLIGYCITASAGQCIQADGCNFCQSYIANGSFYCSCTR
ncbi:hypothetical protein [Pseudomonas moraviensis]|uniref:hypothetical protein n=1 Tax=Pseudomonas moraviensis TaxID=321662 RepID=UPI0012EB87AB|nr:hypothetical protein [Pseudomonas moraviensis]